MPRSLRLTIAEPCHENWQNMTPQEQGRFCGSCQKTVVDFSTMTDQEVLNYFLKADHKVCGRFDNDQLNKELAITEKKKRFSWAYVWNVLLATFLLTEANAQVKPKPKKPVKSIIREEIMGDVVYTPVERVEAVVPIELKGKIVDAKNNQPVAYTSIRVKGQFSVGTMADTSGQFRFHAEKKDSLVLEFSAIGYETQTRVIDGLTNWNDIQVFLKPTFAALQEVSIIAPSTMLQGTAGGVIAYYKETKKEKVKRNINDWVPAALKKDVKLYPNPVMRGNPVQINLSLKRAGDYRLEILNAAGQIVLVQYLVMSTKEQLVDIYTLPEWSAGVYWVRISSHNTKDVYQNKLLLQ